MTCVHKLAVDYSKVRYSINYCGLFASTSIDMSLPERSEQNQA